MMDSELRRELSDIKEALARTETWVKNLYNQKHEPRISSLERSRAGAVAALAVIGVLLGWLIRLVL